MPHRTIWLRRVTLLLAAGLAAFALYHGLVPDRLPSPRDRPATPSVVVPSPAEPDSPSPAVPSAPASPTGAPPAAPGPVRRWDELTRREQAVAAWADFEKQATAETLTGRHRPQMQVALDLYDALRSNPEAWPLLAGQARTAKNPRARAWALAVLRDLARPEEHGLFVACLHDPDSAVRENAARGLLNLKTDEAQAVLREHLLTERAPNVVEVIEKGLK